MLYIVLEAWRISDVCGINVLHISSTSATGVLNTLSTRSVQPLSPSV